MDSKHSIWNASKQPVMSNEGNPLCPRKQAVMSTGGKLLCPTGCERVSRQPSMSYRFRTFSTKKCVPSESRQPLEIKGSGGFQNGLMFQPHPESTSFTSMGSLVRVQLSPPLGALVNLGLRSFYPPAELSATALFGRLKQGFTFPVVNRSPFW